MTFVKNIQGIGSKSDGVYHNGTPRSVCDFDGVTYYEIGDVGSPYVRLDYDIPKTLLFLGKATGVANDMFMYQTATPISDLRDKGESWSFQNNRVGFWVGKPNAGGDYSDITIKKNKWFTAHYYYKGLDISNSPVSICGSNTPNTSNSNVPRSSHLHPNERGRIGADTQAASYFVGQMAIFAIYKGSFNAQQQAEFASDPFGFMARLRAIPTEKAKLYLDINFNKTAPNLPTDEGEGNGGVGFPITLGTLGPAGTIAYTPFA